MSSQEEIEVLLIRSATHEQFVVFAESRGWKRVKAADGDGKTSAFEEIWSVADGGAFVHYVDDPAPESRFLVVRGVRPHIGKVGLALGGGLGVRTTYEILNVADAANSDAKKCRSAMDLVVAHRHEHAEALALLRGFYEGGSEVVRRSVVAALAYRHWPGGLLLLDEIANKDSDDFIRRQAEKTARQWRENDAAVVPGG